MKKARIGALILAASLLFAKPGKVEAMTVDKDDLSDMVNETTITETTIQEVQSAVALQQMLEEEYTIEDFRNKIEEDKTKFAEKFEYTDLEIQAFMFICNFDTLSKKEGLLTEIINECGLSEWSIIGNNWSSFNEKRNNYNKICVDKLDSDNLILSSDFLISKSKQEVINAIEADYKIYLQKSLSGDIQGAGEIMQGFFEWFNGSGSKYPVKFAELDSDIITTTVFVQIGLLYEMAFKTDAGQAFTEQIFDLESLTVLPVDESILISKYNAYNELCNNQAFTKK